MYFHLQTTLNEIYQYKQFRLLPVCDSSRLCRNESVIATVVINSFMFHKTAIVVRLLVETFAFAYWNRLVIMSSLFCQCIPKTVKIHCNKRVKKLPPANADLCIKLVTAYPVYEHVFKIWIQLIICKWRLIDRRSRFAVCDCNFLLLQYWILAIRQ